MNSPSEVESVYDYYISSTVSTDIVTGIGGANFNYAFLTAVVNSAFSAGVTATAYTEL